MTRATHMKTLSESVKAARKRARYTQEELAMRSGLSQSTISDIERGRNESSREILAIASALGLSVEALIGGALPSVKEQSAIYKVARTVNIPIKSLDQIVNKTQGSGVVSAPDTLPDRSVAYCLQTDAMEGQARKYIPRGATLYIVEGAPPEPGKVVLASLDGAEVIGEYSLFAGKPHLRPYNTQYPAVDITAAAIAGTLAGVYWVP